MKCEICEEQDADYVATKNLTLLHVCLDCGVKLVESGGFGCKKANIKNK